MPARAGRVDTMRGTLLRRTHDPVDNADAAPSAKRAKKRKPKASFGKLPQELQKTILQLFYDEEGISWREKIKRLSTIRLICRCTNEWARLALAAHVAQRELERREELVAELQESTFSAVAKAILGKDQGMCALFNVLVQDTDGRSAFKGLRLMAKIFDKEERWLRKCKAHTDAGNESLEGVVPDED